MNNILKVVKYADREDKLILLLSLATAARRVEIFRIQVATDFIAEDNIVVLTTEKTNGRGQRRDKVKIPENLSDPEVYRRKRKISKPASITFALNEANGMTGLRNWRIAQGVKSCLQYTRFDTGLRLSFIKQRVPLTDVQSLLRHTRASTTDKYIHNIGENLDVTYHASSIIASFLDLKKLHKKRAALRLFFIAIFSSMPYIIKNRWFGVDPGGHMAYKENGRWRAAVKFDGTRKTKFFDRRKDAEV